MSILRVSEQAEWRNDREEGQDPFRVITLCCDVSSGGGGNVTNRARAGTNRDFWDETAAELGRNGGFGPHLDVAERLPNPIPLE
jgi:hypothetical protein